MLVMIIIWLAFVADTAYAPVSLFQGIIIS